MAGPDKMLMLNCQDETLFMRSEGLSLTFTDICANGPAIKGGCGTWRSHPVYYPGTLAVIYPGGKTGMACFLPIQA
jgi:hypothetical protein